MSEAGETGPRQPAFERIRADNPGPMTLSGTNTFVVGGDPAWVIDPGPDDPAHIAAVREAGEARGGIGGVLLTHSHADHSAGVDRLGAPLLWGSVSATDETNWSPDAERRPAAEAPDEFEVIPTPGHSADHVCFVWRGMDVCFSGDLMFRDSSSIVPPAAFGGSLEDYLASLERMREVDAALFEPGHGPNIADPIGKIDAYVAHRLERERRLADALDAGERSRDALLDAVWDDVPPILRPAAAMAMQAHLEKLQAEGRVETESLQA